MATTKTASKKKAAAKKGGAKKVAPKEKATENAAPVAAERAVASHGGLIDVLTLDAAKDAVAPDASSTALVTHAESLAGTMRSLLEALALAKLGEPEAARLEGMATLLRAREGEWQKARKATATGAVAACRAPLMEGRNDLYGAIDAFVEDESAAKELEEIGTVDDDDDLEDDSKRLIALARKHADDLDGTEITVARVDEVEVALKAFHDARKGVVAAEGEGEGDTKQALSEAARVALELRNRAFWALSALDRKVCRQARFRFRKDAKRRALFNAYVTEAKSAQKAKTPKVPKEPKATEATKEPKETRATKGTETPPEPTKP